MGFVTQGYTKGACMQQIAREWARMKFCDCFFGLLPKMEGDDAHRTGVPTTQSEFRPHKFLPTKNPADNTYNQDAWCFR